MKSRFDSGIYTITSPSGRRYIGSAVNFKKRWYHHRYQLRKGDHHSRPLQRAANKHGMENLKFEILLICQREDLIFYEQRAIDILRPKYNRNQRACGGGMKPKDCFENTLTKEAADQIVAEYMAGGSLRKLKKKYRTNTEIMRRVIVANGGTIHLTGVKASQVIPAKAKLASGEIKTQIAADYTIKKLGINPLAKKYGIPIRWVAKILTEMGIRRSINGAPKGRPSFKALARKLNDEAVASIIADYGRGLGLLQIAEKFGSTSTQAIRRILVSAGVEIKTPGWRTPEAQKIANAKNSIAMTLAWAEGRHARAKSRRAESLGIGA